MDIQELLKFYGIDPKPTKNMESGGLDTKQQHGGEAASEIRKSDQGVGIPDSDVVLRPKSFAEILSGKQSVIEIEEEAAVPLIKVQPPQLEGGNLTVIIDEGEYMKRVEDNKYNVIGRVNMKKGDPLLSTLELRKKLESVWGITWFKVTPVGRAHYQILLISMGDHSTIMSIGTINLKPGIFRVAQWIRDFNPTQQRQTNAQVWVRISN